MRVLQDRTKVFISFYQSALLDATFCILQLQKNKRRTTLMKTKKNPHLRIHRPNQPAYPNAADNRYFANKALNVMTAIVSGMGFISAMAFLVTLA